MSDLINTGGDIMEMPEAVEILKPIYPAIFSSIIRLLAEEQGKTFAQVLAEIEGAN